MGSGESILFALAFHNVLFHILLTSKIEGVKGGVKVSHRGGGKGDHFFFF
jgi:hypothetical protein